MLLPTSSEEGERARVWDGHGDQHPARTAAGGRRYGRRRTAAGSAPRADGRGGVSPQTNGAEGRGSGGPPPRRSAPRVNGRGGTSLRRPRNGRGDRRPARMAARICRRGQAAGRGSGRGRRTATEISARANGHEGVSPRTSGREGRGSGDLPLQRSAPRANDRGGTLLRRSRNGRSDRRPARHVAADKRRGGMRPQDGHGD